MLEHGVDGAAASESGPAALFADSARLTRILVADDHEIVRLGLRAMLESRAGWKVVAEAANGREAITKALASKPHIVIMDYCLPLMNGVEATRQIRARLPKTEIMIFTVHDSDALIGELLQAGARAYLPKSEAKRNLFAAVESLIEHKPFFTGRVSEHLLEACVTAYRHKGGGGALSPRERTIVQLIAEGNGNKAMAAILNLSVKTVESHRATAMRKLNISSTAGIVRYAVRNNLVEA
jgi:DNA-binding NarL/FixJ family response regulator